MFSRANSSTNIVRTSYRRGERSEPSPSVIIPSKDEDRAEAARRFERVGAERERERANTDAPVNERVDVINSEPSYQHAMLRGFFTESGYIVFVAFLSSLTSFDL